MQNDNGTVGQCSTEQSRAIFDHELSDEQLARLRDMVADDGGEVIGVDGDPGVVSPAEEGHYWQALVYEDENGQHVGGVFYVRANPQVANNAERVEQGFANVVPLAVPEADRFTAARWDVVLDDEAETAEALPYVDEETRHRRLVKGAWTFDVAEDESANVTCLVREADNLCILEWPLERCDDDSPNGAAIDNAKGGPR